MNNYPKLFFIIKDYEIFIVAIRFDEQNNFELLEKLSLPIESQNENKISDLDKIADLIKKNILLIEQKTNFIFKDIIIILDSFEKFYISLSGFKKLNGTQISKENITYILNSLKSNVEKFENRKKIIHIFNSKFTLDKKKIDNLPIGLFGDFYTHELSFNMINKNDFKNLKKIFEKCNLKIKKILFDCFVKGALLSEKNPKIESFYYIQLNKENTKIFYLENDAVIFEQKFKFGTEIISQDICKVTYLEKDIIEKMIRESINIEEFSKSEFIEEKYFQNGKYRKIKKVLIKDIAEARIKELSEIIFSRNINFKQSNKEKKVIFLDIKDKDNLNYFKNTYNHFFSNNAKFELKFFDKTTLEDFLIAADKIVQFGWKKEAIPVSGIKKSIIARFFGLLFNN